MAAIVDVQNGVNNLKQKADETLSEYLERFKAACDLQKTVFNGPMYIPKCIEEKRFDQAKGRRDPGRRRPPDEITLFKDFCNKFLTREKGEACPFSGTCRIDIYGCQIFRAFIEASGTFIIDATIGDIFERYRNCMIVRLRAASDFHADDF